MKATLLGMAGKYLHSTCYGVETSILELIVN